MGAEQLVFIFLILVGMSICALLFGIRYMRNKENMSMIEKGLDPTIKPERPRPAPFRNLKWGLLITGAGLGLLGAYLLDHTLLYGIGHTHRVFSDGAVEDYVSGANVPIYFALITIGGGLGLISSYRIEKRELLDKK